MVFNFDKWNNLKKELQKNDKKYYFKEWEIWWISLWQNIWTESFWKWNYFRRPVLILKKLSWNSLICLPLSSKQKKGTWFTKCNLHDIERTVLLYQIKMINTNRFERRVWQISDNDFWKIKKRLKILLSL